MTDPQMMTLALAVFIPLSMLLYSNSRITEAKETLRAEIRAETAALKMEMADLKHEMADLKHEMADLKREIMTAIERLEAKLTIHEMEHHRR
jgi:septal ring factor EnvC (AmiA/AmiB activator)